MQDLPSTLHPPAWRRPQISAPSGTACRAGCAVNCISRQRADEHECCRRSVSNRSNRMFARLARCLHRVPSFRSTIDFHTTLCMRRSALPVVVRAVRHGASTRSLTRRIFPSLPDRSKLSAAGHAAYIARPAHSTFSAVDINVRADMTCARLFISVSYGRAHIRLWSSREMRGESDWAR